MCRNSETNHLWKQIATACHIKKTPKTLIQDNIGVAQRFGLLTLVGLANETVSSGH